mmetsp:Transcript_46439/g.54263  ORF Transcript_46439/g.54263 Transcript_46439/m.54263 type:complete len:137 (+) Transcript_46439:229-639(+)
MIASKLSLSSTTHPYLVEGCNTITTADISLFTTLSRFDEIYRIHYKTNSRIVARTPSLLRFMRRVFNIRGVSKTCNMNEMKVYVRKFSGEKVFSSKNYNAASNWTIDGFQALVTLFIAIACAEMFNQGSCQRVFLG